MPSPKYPFYFAWADATDTTFGSQFEVVDEDIFSFVVHHEEGQIPDLEITLRNPRIGLLHGTRKVWAWLSYGPPSGAVIPIFFGELVGLPTNLFDELVTLKFHARPTTYIEDKQAVAETLKTRPYYDPIWIDKSHRDDPDAILEGWSALYHVDRVTHVVTASDILTGEDGLIDFGDPTTTHAFYRSLSLKVGEAPLTNIKVEANVRWTQRYEGLLQWPTVSLATYTGDGFMSDWPKGGATLGGGWRVEDSFVNDVYMVGITPMTNYHYSWTNTDNEKLNCAPESVEVSSSGPALLSPAPITCTLLGKGNSGVCDPYSDPPTNIAAHAEASGVIIPLWFLSCDMQLRYDAKREFTEELSFNLTGNTQGVITSPTVSQNTELMKISGADVGEPLEIMEAWSDFKGKAVPVATMIYPNDPHTPGGLSYQVCITAGTAGATEPVFSDIPGTVTNDGTVRWSSMGDTPLTNCPNWENSSPVPLGEIILFVPQYQQALFNTQAGNFEPDATNFAYFLCIGAGVTNSVFSSFVYIPTVISNDEFTPVPAQITYIKDPTFTATPGATVLDGTVTWLCLGTFPVSLSTPLGGTPLRLGARCFFPTPRGHMSVEHLICKARARMRKRARAITVGWEAPFEQCLGLSCRVDARIQDPRIPGGTATGKVIAYELHMDPGGKWFGKVEVGCSIGYAGTVNADAGTGDYASSGYMQSGYQQVVSSIVTPTDNSDIGYTPPAFLAFDDGIQFPITEAKEVNAGDGLSNTAAAQAAAIECACPVSATLSQMENPIFPGTGISFNGAWAIETAQRVMNSGTIQYIMQSCAVSYEAFIRPVTNGPFNGSYNIHTTPLEFPKGINLEASSSP